MRRKIFVFIENHLPIIASALIIGSLYFLKHKFNIIDKCGLGKNYKEIYISLITVCSILTALLATIKTIIVSIPENKGIKKLKNNSLAFNAFVNQIFSSIISNIILIALCFVLLILEKENLDFGWLCLVWIFFLSYSIISFCWLEYLFFKLIKASR